MLIAHCKLHQALKARGSEQKLGVTHQWMKFDTAGGNWLEKLFAYYFTKFGFTPVYDFFKDGRFSFKFPFMANITFEIPKGEFDANQGFLERIGVQAYPKAMVKMGLNHGETYPGHPHSIKNLPFFSFGASCEPGGTVMSFGPRWKAEGMDEVLDEAFALKKEVFITEFGSDARVFHWGAKDFARDNQGQAEYLQKLTERVRDYCARTGSQVQGIFAWSDLTRQQEWENGHDCTLGMIDPIVDENRRMTGYTETPASEYLKNVYGQGARREEVPVAG
jgi:beta-glucosidase/6-phospho-beta-glucosidase/beta-galactosidase